MKNGNGSGGHPANGTGTDGGSKDEPNHPPQLHIFDGSTREFDVGTLMTGDDRWALHVVLERTSADLFRGRISFRRDEERYDTDPIVLGETEGAVVERAAELPASMLRQLLDSLRE
ncbi:MAG: hypothetical protein ACODAA_05205 [Gemmatimonadota bacterium]